MNTAPAPAGFDEVQWQGLVDYLRDCPGSLCAALLPAPTAGDVLVGHLTAAVRPLPVRVAPDGLQPVELGQLALRLSSDDFVLLISLDGRRVFTDEAEAQAFYESLNFQREALAAGRLRTCFLLDERNDARMIRHADDLREWVKFFRFPNAPVLAQPGVAEEWSLSRDHLFRGDVAPPDVLYDQLRRAKETGLPHERVVRDYAAPLFEALVRRGNANEAWQVWSDEFGGDACLDLLQQPLRQRTLSTRTQLALLRGSKDEREAWTLRLLREAEDLGDTGAVAEAAVIRGDYLRSIGDLDQALHLYQQVAAPRYARLQIEHQHALVMARVADILRRRGELDQALHILRHDVLLRMEQEGDARGLAVTWGKVADVLQLRGDMVEALRIRRDLQLPAFDRLGDERERAATVSRIADALKQQGDLEEALRLLREEVLPVYERFGESQARAVTQGKIAEMLVMQGETAEAVRILGEDVMPVLERVGDVHSQSVAWRVLALAFFRRGEHRTTLRILRDSVLPILEQEGDMRSWAVTMESIADALFVAGQVDDALQILRKDVLPIASNYGDAELLMSARSKLARVLIRRNAPGDREEAVFLLQQALTAAQQMNLPQAQAIEAALRDVKPAPTRPASE